MSAKLQSAVQFACKAHYGQVRDGEHPVPYLCHPLEVLANLRYLGNVTDEDQLCAAVLHDVLEECDVSVGDLSEAFGNAVCQLVQDLTRKEPTAAETAAMSKDQIWELRSKLLLEDISRMPARAWPVKLSDRLSNLREAKYAKTPKKLGRYREQTKSILKLIPRDANPGLWDAIKAEIGR